MDVMGTEKPDAELYESGRVAWLGKVCGGR